MLLDYCYRADFALSGIIVNKKLKKDSFELAPDPESKDSAILKYFFCMPNLSEVEAEQKAINDVDKFLSFFFLGLSMGNGVRAFSTKFLKIECTNYLELVTARKETPMFEHFLFPATYRIDERTLEVITNSFNKYSRAVKDTYWVSANFWRSGLATVEEYQRYDHVWKSFEIFHRELTGKNEISLRSCRNWVSKALSPQGIIDLGESFSKAEDNEIGLNVKLLKCSSAIECIATRVVAVSKSGRINYSQNLSNATIAKNWNEALANLLVCLAKLRNKIFHANVYSNRDRPLVSVGALVLADIMNSAFHNSFI